MSDNVIRNPNKRICNKWRVFDHADDANFRMYRGKYPRDGYDVNTTNPLRKPVDRKPPPLRGC